MKTRLISDHSIITKGCREATLAFVDIVNGDKANELFETHPTYVFFPTHLPNGKLNHKNIYVYEIIINQKEVINNGTTNKHN